jgi:hypothetical protein
VQKVPRPLRAKQGAFCYNEVMKKRHLFGLTLMFICLLLGSYTLWQEMKVNVDKPIPTDLENEDGSSFDNESSVIVTTPIANSAISSPVRR